MARKAPLQLDSEPTDLPERRIVDRLARAHAIILRIAWRRAAHERSQARSGVSMDHTGMSAQSRHPRLDQEDIESDT